MADHEQIQKELLESVIDEMGGQTVTGTIFANSSRMW